MSALPTNLEQPDQDRADLARFGPGGWYALAGELTGDVLTHHGRVIVHRDRDELAFLVPNGARIVPAPLDAPGYVPLSAHPDMAAVTWPLKREDFRR